MSNSITCEWCDAVVEGTDLDTFADAFLTHVRSVHSDFPYPDQAVRNYAEATQRLTGGTERLDTIGAVTVERVTRERIDDWLDFFDHDATAGTPQFGACYCSEPHVLDPNVPPADQPPRTTRENRDTMIALLEQGRSFGYLAYVDAKPAAWVNASLRSEYRQYARGEASDPADADVIGIACFTVAPPYQRHGLAEALLEKVLDDAPARGARWIEAYPMKEELADRGRFRGARAMYDAHGFTPVVTRAFDTVVRRAVSSTPA